MGYPVAAGSTDYSASSVAYIPAVYAGKLLIKFYEATVLSEVTNTDYEGTITKFGDHVIIRTNPDITINDYIDGQTLVFQQPSSAPVQLDINKGKSWSFVERAVVTAQTDIKNYTEKWTEDASEQMKIAIDTDVLGNVYADVSSYNKGGTAGYKTSGFNLGVDGASGVAVTKSNVLDYIVDCGTVLSEYSVPEDGRFMVIPPWMAGLIKKSDLKDASLSGDGQSIMRNGRLGIIDSFTLFKSNLLAVTTDGTRLCTHVLFGTKHAITFATQLVENKVTDNPFGFGTLYKGLQVYGYKVVKAQALGDFYCYKSS